MATAGQTLLAFDFGTSHIGVAAGQTVTASATPLAPLKARDGVPDWEQVAALLAEWRPAAVVVGLPLNMDDSESELSRRARRFANRVHGRFGLEVVLHDERLSSAEARGRLAPGDPERRRGGRIDSLAAVVILESYLAGSVS